MFLLGSFECGLKRLVAINIKCAWKGSRSDLSGNSEGAFRLVVVKVTFVL